MTHKNSAGNKRDDFKTFNCTSSAVQKLRFGVKRKLSESSFQKKKEPTHLEFYGESYDQISEQRSDLLKIRESAFSDFVVAVFGFGFCTSLSS